MHDGSDDDSDDDSDRSDRSDRSDDARIRFPDLPKLELDDLIDQLVERAQQVKRAQGRLRSLLRAIETVAGDLSLETVLSKIVQAACELATARYGALGVIGPDNGLEQFIHVGLDAATVDRIGRLPEGKGLIGALISDPRPIRLESMSDDERSIGTPAGHPAMSSFLGVPIHVRDRVFGNLYLADSVNGAFSAEDEELVVALALAAGTAVSNARLYQESRLQQRWLSASVEIGAQLLSAHGEDPIRTIAQRAIDLAEADLVTVGLLTHDRSAMVIEVAFGVGAEGLIGRRFALDETAAGPAVAQQQPVLVRDGSAQGVRDQFGTELDAGPLMVLPLRSGNQVRGVLMLTRARGRGAFAPSELEMAAGFAGNASVALELADSRTAEQRVVLLEDRDRIARDLHDHVIQELFAIGLRLESVAAGLGPDSDAGRRLTERIEDIDRTIRRIRTSIFALRGPLDLSGDGLRRQILEIASDLTPALGFPARVTFDGPVDSVIDSVDDADIDADIDDDIDADIDDDIVAVVREALTNVAKHAYATAASVDLSATPSDVVLVVADNGRGLGEPSRNSGLANLRARAARHGGSMTATDAAGGGTVLTWKAPLARRPG